MATEKLKAFALKTTTNGFVPGSLVKSYTQPSTGPWVHVIEGVIEASPNPTDYNNTVRSVYPNAVSAEIFGEHAKQFIKSQGYTPDNIVLSDSICSDDVDGPVYSDVSNIGQTPASQNQFLGAFMSGGFSGQVTDIEIHARESVRIKQTLNNIYTKHIGQKKSVIEAAMERDNFMTADEAKEFGIVDHVIATREDIAKIVV